MEARWKQYWDASVLFARREGDRLLRCRECDDRVQLFEKTCPHCGAADATRIPLTASAALLGMPVAVGLLYFAFRWAF